MTTDRRIVLAERLSKELSERYGCKFIVEGSSGEPEILIYARNAFLRKKKELVGDEEER